MDASLPERWTEGTVESNGVRLHYTRTGTEAGSESTRESPPLVIAHGVFDDGPCRAPLAEDLEADYDVISYDARGHGRSDAPESGYALSDRVADLVGLIDALDLEDPILFGHSMGGDTVAATAAAYPDLPRAVVMEDPAALLAHTDPDSAPDDRIEDVRERIEWWNDRSTAELLEEDEELRGHVEAGDDRLASLLAAARQRVSPAILGVFEHGFVDPAEAYPEITAPTLILRADVNERQRTRDRELVELLPSGRLVHVEGTGHCVFRDDRETATSELHSFLANV